MRATSAPRSPRSPPTGRVARAGRRVQALVATRTPSPRFRRCSTRSRGGDAGQPLPGRRRPLLAARAPRRAVRRHRRRGARRRGLGVDPRTSSFRPPPAPGDEVVYAWRSFEAYPGLVTVAGATSVQVPNRRRRRARPRRDGRGDHRPHPRRHRLLAQQPDEHRRDGGRVRGVHGAGAGHRARAARRGVPRVRRPTRRPSTASPLLERYPNLVVLRTFSKAYGLAGLRVGYAVGPAYILDAARRPRSRSRSPSRRSARRSPRSTPRTSCCAQVGDRRARRERVRAALLEQGWPLPEPQGNFVWLPTGARTTAAAADGCSRPAGSSRGCSRRRASGCRSARRSLWRNSYAPPPRLSRPSHRRASRKAR